MIPSKSQQYGKIADILQAVSFILVILDSLRMLQIFYILFVSNVFYSFFIPIDHRLYVNGYTGWSVIGGTIENRVILREKISRKYGIKSSQTFYSVFSPNLFSQNQSVPNYAIGYEPPGVYIFFKSY